MIHPLPHCPKQGPGASAVLLQTPGGSRVGGEEEELVKEETLGDPVCPLPAESDPQLIPETRKRGSFCSWAVRIWPSVSFQGFWFFQGALDKLQPILGRYEFQEPRVQNRCPQQTFQMESVADSLTLFPVNASFSFFFFLEKALVFATWVTYGHMDSHTWIVPFNRPPSILSLFGAEDVLISG